MFSYNIVSANNASAAELFNIYVNTSNTQANKSIKILASDDGYNWSVNKPTF